MPTDWFAKGQAVGEEDDRRDRQRPAGGAPRCFQHQNDQRAAKDVVGDARIIDVDTCD